MSSGGVQVRTIDLVAVVSTAGGAATRLLAAGQFGDVDDDDPPCEAGPV